MQDGVQCLDARIAIERAPAGQQLEQHRAEREHIRAFVRRLAADLFRRHVAGRAEHRVSRGPQWRRHRPSIEIRIADAKLGDAEVENLHAPVARDHHVLRLEIAVHDPLRVRRGEAACIAAAISQARAAGIAPRPMQSRSVSPSSSSITRYGRPSAVPTSYSVSTLG